MGEESSGGCVRSRVRVVVRVIAESMALACRTIIVSKDKGEEGQDPIIGCCRFEGLFDTNEGRVR